MRDFLRARNKEVVDVSKAERQTSEKLVDVVLEGLRRVLETKRLPDVLEQTEGRQDGPDSGGMT